MPSSVWFCGAWGFFHPVSFLSLSDGRFLFHLRLKGFFFVYPELIRLDSFQPCFVLVRLISFFSVNVEGGRAKGVVPSRLVGLVVLFEWIYWLSFCQDFATA